MTEETSSGFPTPEDFCLNVPLYKVYQLNSHHAVALYRLENFRGPVDIFCPECGRPSTFHRWLEQNQKQKPLPAVLEVAYDRIFIYWLLCAPNGSHRQLYIFLVGQNGIQKIGQYPSIADLMSHDVAKYRKVLGRKWFPELTRAIGLAAHGVGVGSFVYLRRILEHLVEEAHDHARQDPGWNEDNYPKGHMVEQIGLLKDLLPEFLVQNRQLYGILSKGLHELSEDGCLEAFPLVKVGIEIVLDSKIEESQKAEKLREAQQAIQALVPTLRKDSQDT